MSISAIAILATPSRATHCQGCVGGDFERKYEVKTFPYEDGIRLRFENMVLLHSKILLSLANRLR
jgi:hypothetical protein